MPMRQIFPNAKNFILGIFSILIGMRAELYFHGRPNARQYREPLYRPQFPPPPAKACRPRTSRPPCSSDFRRESSPAIRDRNCSPCATPARVLDRSVRPDSRTRSEEHTSELQSL